MTEAGEGEHVAPVGEPRWRRPQPVGIPLASDATELRWFAKGRLPERVREWFSRPQAATEIPMTAGPTGAGCDVELAHVAVGSTDAWKFAFEAFGPPTNRRAALKASWRTWTASPGVPATLVQCLGRSMGYPQWPATQQVQEQLASQ